MFFCMCHRLFLWKVFSCCDAFLASDVRIGPMEGFAAGSLVTPSDEDVCYMQHTTWYQMWDHSPFYRIVEVHQTCMEMEVHPGTNILHFCMISMLFLLQSVGDLIPKVSGLFNGMERRIANWIE